MKYEYFGKISYFINLLIKRLVCISHKQSTREAIKAIRLLPPKVQRNQCRKVKGSICNYQAYQYTLSGVQVY